MLLFFAAIALLTGCGDDRGSHWRLYHTGVDLPAMRSHVATFDADEPGNYNRQSCEIARDLFQNQPGVTVAYWCELR